MTSRLVGLAALAAGPVAILGVFFLLPVGGMLALGLWPEGSFDPSGALAVLGADRTLRVVWFTVWSASVATVLTVLLGVPAAHVTYRLAFPGVRLARLVLVVPFVLPTVVVGLAFDNLLAGPLAGLGLSGTPAAIIAALVFFNLSVVVRTVGPAWEALDPRPAEAAAALGAGPLRVFCDVTLPALRGPLVSAASVVFLYCATAFGLVLVLGGLRYATVETEIYLLTTQLLDLQGAAALSLLQLAVVVVLLALAHRLRAVGVVARGTGRARTARRRDLLPVLLALPAFALVLVPIGALVAGALRVDDAWSLANFRALGSIGEHAGVSVPVTAALRTSLQTAADATWMALLLGTTVAVLVTRRSHSAPERRLRGLLDGLFMLPLGVSAVTLGFGFLVTLDEPPLDLRTSPLLVPLAQALVALPLVVRILVPVLSGIDDRQRQAAASLGAGPLRVLATIDLAVVWKPLLAAAGFAFVVSLGEFGATSFLVREDEPTLPVVIYRLLSHPGVHNYGMALAASLVLAGLTALVLVLVERLRVPGVGGF